MPFYLRNRFQAYTELWQPMVYGLWYFVQSLSISLQGARSRGFATWYSTLGHHFAAYEEAATPVPRLVEAANGVVLEIGPGSGNQFSRFDKTVISRIYGIEPNEHLFNQLRNETIQLHHLSDVYVPINAAFEDKNILEEWNIRDESIDSVVCMQALCSVSDSTAAVKQIYRLLKPGGQLLFWEHTASQDWVTRQIQGIWNVLWKRLIGNCHLRRDIEQAVMEAGDWKIIELGHDNIEPWQMMPRVWGHFVKI